MSVSVKYEALVFDLDGTLLDTLEDLADSMNGTLGHFGFPPHPVDAYRYFVGDGMENLVRRAVPASVKEDAEVISRCLNLMRDTYRRNWKVKSRPYPGIPEMLDALRDRRAKLTVLSNKPHEFTRKVVEEMLSNWRFDIVFGERPSIPRKPDPASALEIAERLGLPPDKFLYLGDTATDMITANAAGMYPVGALWGFRTAEELLGSGAKKLIQRPAELLELL